MYLPSIVMVGYYFEKKRAFATGIAVCGSGIGGFVFAPLTAFLLEKFSWKGTLWILSALVLNGVVFVQAFRPLHKKEKTGSKCSKKIQSKDEPLKPFSALDLELCEKHPIYKCRSVEAMHASNGKQDSVVRLAQSQDISKLNDVRLRHERNHSDTLKPLERKDIFYSGSLKNIPHTVETGTNGNRSSMHSLSRNMDVDVESADSDENACSKVASSLASSFDFSLLKSPTFIIYGLSCFLCMFGMLSSLFSLLIHTIVNMHKVKYCGISNVSQNENQI